MERLILEYQVGDGYTYSATQTLGIIYKDKLSALEDLHLLLLETIDKENQNQKISETLHEKLLSNTKNREVFTQVHAQLLQHEKSLSKTIHFGGLELNYNDFIYNEGNGSQVSLPNIYTLEEFFAPAEKNALNPETNITKPKFK